jgi:hypothetical protein
MPVHKRIRLQRLLLAYLLVAWGSSWAVIERAQPDLAGLPWAQALVGVGVAWIGGCAATLSRMVTALYDDTEFHKPYEFARDGSVSAVVGLAGYMVGVENQTSPAQLALILLLGGYAGARALAVWVDRLLKPKGPE